MCKPLIKASPSSISEVSDFLALAMFPNPAADYVVLSGLESVKNVQLEVWSASGQNVFNRTTSGKREIVLNVSEFDQGIYLVRAYADNKVQTLTFLKQ